MWLWRTYRWDRITTLHLSELKDYWEAFGHYSDANGKVTGETGV